MSSERTHFRGSGRGGGGGGGGGGPGRGGYSSRGGGGAPSSAAAAAGAGSHNNNNNNNNARRPAHHQNRGNRESNNSRGGEGGGERGERPRKENILDLSKYMDQAIGVKFGGGREVVGTLKGYDQLMNLVLDDVKEVMRDDEGNESSRQLGLVVARGTLLVLVAPLDGSAEIPNPFLQQQQQEEED
ncbi:MAG: Sm-like protein lsm7 [Peltula sp. TS41687]|nr:MAG: Sm-like protein lsm7 [Peltula sp. TS41687]